jgi:hypothetical protein
VSRSATLVVAYLMRREGLRAAEALQRIQLQRSCANPNSGFREQLLKYEAELQARARARAQEGATALAAPAPADVVADVAGGGQTAPAAAAVACGGGPACE